MNIQQKIDNYLLKEDVLSKEHEKKAREAGHATAKAVFGKEYDQAKADKTIDEVLKKFKEKHDKDDPGDIIAIVQHAFRGDSEE